MSEYSKTALSWGGLKDALLYFPYVISLFEPEHFPLVIFLTEHFPPAVTENQLLGAWEQKLLPPDIPDTAINDLEGFRESFRSLMRHIVRKLVDRYSSNQWDILDPTDSAIIGPLFEDALRGEPAGATLRKALLSLYVHYKPCPSLPLICSGGSIESATTSTEDVAFTVSSLRLIDTRPITLEQLLEMRKDAEAMEKLRRFRLFAYENYQGKSKDYIEDDIQSRLVDYERAVKKWGFTTASGAITTLLNSSLIAGGVVGSFLTGYYKAPIEAIVSTMSATGLAIANMVVSLGQQRFARKELVATNPVSYISFVKDKLANKKASAE